MGWLILLSLSERSCCCAPAVIYALRYHYVIFLPLLLLLTLLMVDPGVSLQVSGFHHDATSTLELTAFVNGRTVPACQMPAFRNQVNRL